MMKRLSNARCALLAALLCITSPNVALASELAQYLRADHPESYVVVKGDTLWDISGRFLQKPWLWPNLWRNNPQIENPHLIYPGDRIYLVWVDGEPRLSLERGALSGTERLEPAVRSTPLESAIPAIRLDAIQSFLVQNRVVEPEALEDAPYVLEGESERLVMGAGDNVYVRGELGDSGRVSVVRKGPIYKDPETGEVLGMEATFVGLGDTIAQDGEVATVLLTQVREETHVGDRVLPTEERHLDANFFPRAPSVEVHGQIISVFGGVSQIGPFDVVVLNRGEREGLQVGDTLAIYKRGAMVKDRYKRDTVQLPSERAGLLMVFRSFEKLSYALVLQSDRPLVVSDEVRNP